MVVDMRHDVSVIILRDRDFRTDAEMRFEILTADGERQRNGIQRVTEVFTPLNGVEHSFAQPDHLKQVFTGRLAAEIIKGSSPMPSPTGRTSL